MCSCNKTDTPEKGPEYDYTCEWCDAHPQGDWDAVKAALLEAVADPSRQPDQAFMSAAEFYKEWIKRSGHLGKVFKTEMLFEFAEAYLRAAREYSKH